MRMQHTSDPWHVDPASMASSISAVQLPAWRRWNLLMRHVATPSWQPSTCAEADVDGQWRRFLQDHRSFAIAGDAPPAHMHAKTRLANRNVPSSRYRQHRTSWAPARAPALRPTRSQVRQPGKVGWRQARTHANSCGVCANGIGRRAFLFGCWPELMHLVLAMHAHMVGVT